MKWKKKRKGNVKQSRKKKKKDVQKELSLARDYTKKKKKEPKNTK